MVRPATPDSSQHRLSGFIVVGGTFGVIVFHIVATLLLYPRGRQISAFGIPAEFVVFLLPTILAYLGFISLLRARYVRLMPPWVGAFLLTTLSFSLSLLLPFNIYGS